ncbi:hypothetical protein B0H16DRAFT_1686664 [Mycena metata]|uniref:Uncharacterized protein n=1 Tax=Mycena metata TaxID=1033252 RepID=A0AAD7JLX4_9AGAR|nr:hypothetical protein B0H16DRAFT_1686664 [Mycena metata]
MTQARPLINRRLIKSNWDIRRNTGYNNTHRVPHDAVTTAGGTLREGSILTGFRTTPLPPAGGTLREVSAQRRCHRLVVLHRAEERGGLSRWKNLGKDKVSRTMSPRPLLSVVGGTEGSVEVRLKWRRKGFSKPSDFLLWFGFDHGDQWQDRRWHDIFVSPLLRVLVSFFLLGLQTRFLARNFHPNQTATLGPRNLLKSTDT